MQLHNKRVVNLAQNISLSLGIPHHILLFNLTFVKLLHGKLLASLHIFNQVDLAVGTLSQKSNREEIVNGYLTLLLLVFVSLTLRKRHVILTFLDLVIVFVNQSFSELI